MDVVRLELDFEGEKNLIRQGKKEIFHSEKFFSIRNFSLLFSKW